MSQLPARVPFPLVFFLAFLPLGQRAVAANPTEPQSIENEVGLSSEGLFSALARLQSRGLEISTLVQGDTGGFGLRGGLIIENQGEQRLVAGPGSVDGPLRLLFDHLGEGLASQSSHELGLDPTLLSTLLVLGVEGDGWSAFGLARGAGAGLLLSRGGFGSAPGTEGLLKIEGVGAGLRLSGSFAGLRFGGILGLGRFPSGTGDTGWYETVPAWTWPDPMLALFCSSRGLLPRLSFALAFSDHALAGPGMAGRLEAGSGFGLFEAEGGIAARSGNFRSWEAESRGLLGRAFVDATLRTSTPLAFGLRSAIEAVEGQSSSAPCLARKLRLRLNYGAGSTTSISGRIDIEASNAKESRALGASLFLAASSPGGRFDFDLGATLSLEGGFEGEQTLAARFLQAMRAPGSASLSAGFELGLRSLKSWSLATRARSLVDITELGADPRLSNIAIEATGGFELGFETGWRIALSLEQRGIKVRRAGKEIEGGRTLCLVTLSRRLPLAPRQG